MIEIRPEDLEKFLEKHEVITREMLSGIKDKETVDGVWISDEARNETN